VIFPLGHENQQGRRWPWVTIGIIALNFVVFAATHGRMEGEYRQYVEVETQILQLAALHPATQTTPAEQRLIDTFKQGYPKDWERMGSQNRDLSSLFDLKIRDIEPDEANELMAGLGTQFEQLQNDTIMAKYAFTPARRTAISYLTANFLHGGWLHIIFNMWFLWLAGAVLEDVWGRPVYGTFYLISGAIALVFHGIIFPHSLIPVIGASGAIASLMGAFLVRFPKTKIKLGMLFFLRIWRFSWPAYAVLPLWFVGQLFWAMLSGEGGGVAYWVHVSGFAFGAAMAMVLRSSGAEHAINQSIEAKVGWSADPRIVRAQDAMEHGQMDAAVTELRNLIAEQPANSDAHQMLAAAYWRKSDPVSHRAELEALCSLHLKAQNPEAAWQDYEDFRGAGGEKIAPATWLELCRYLESKQNFDRAVSEYESLAAAWPSERSSVMALISAGRINLKQLQNRDAAARFYNAAKASKVPHADWDDTIRRGIEQATGVASSKPEMLPAGPGFSRPGS